jgi:hypothetical protein
MAKKKDITPDKPANPNRVRELLYQVSGKLHEVAQDSYHSVENPGVIALCEDMATQKAASEANGVKLVFKHKSKPLANLMQATTKELGWL